MKIVKKPYCKVCHDAGKPESEYTSHWVKDQSGKTTCPFLLSLKCRYCNEAGHTVKHCVKLVKDNKEDAKKTAQKAYEAKQQQQQNDNKQKSNQNKEQKKNTFACLDDSDEEGEAPMKIQVEHKDNSWANIVAKEQEPEPKEELDEMEQFLNQPGVVIFGANKHREVRCAPAPWVKEPVQKKSWVNMSDSEDEEDYEDETW